MKFSKKYPSIALMKREIAKKGATKAPIKEAINGRFKKSLTDTWEKMYDIKLESLLSAGKITWYEPCESLFIDAEKNYTKLANLPVNKGKYIVTGINFYQQGIQLSALINVSADGNIKLSCCSGDVPVPEMTVEVQKGDNRIKWMHSNGNETDRKGQESDVLNFYCRAMSVILFAQYSSTEAKEKMLAPVPRKMNCIRPDKNDLGIKRIKLTASWYRDTVQGHPFTVRGHWRMQAFGKGMKDRKLKFISTHMKRGYRSKPLKDK